ncbi:hypothetical protein MMPV_005237 [Pyropia vietnamensis]
MKRLPRTASPAAVAAVAAVTSATPYLRAIARIAEHPTRAAERTIFAQLLYRNTSQHRHGPYFSRLRGARRAQVAVDAAVKAVLNAAVEATTLTTGVASSSRGRMAGLSGDQPRGDTGESLSAAVKGATSAAAAAATLGDCLDTLARAVEYHNQCTAPVAAEAVWSHLLSRAHFVGFGVTAVASLSRIVAVDQRLGEEAAAASRVVALAMAAVTARPGFAGDAGEEGAAGAEDIGTVLSRSPALTVNGQSTVRGARSRGAAPPQPPPSWAVAPLGAQQMAARALPLRHPVRTALPERPPLPVGLSLYDLLHTDDGDDLAMAAATSTLAHGGGPIGRGGDGGGGGGGGNSSDRSVSIGGSGSSGSRSDSSSDGQFSGSDANGAGAGGSDDSGGGGVANVPVSDVDGMVDVTLSGGRRTVGARQDAACGIDGAGGSVVAAAAAPGEAAGGRGGAAAVATTPTRATTATATATATPTASTAPAATISLTPTPTPTPTPASSIPASNATATTITATTTTTTTSGPPVTGTLASSPRRQRQRRVREAAADIDALFDLL